MKTLTSQIFLSLGLPLDAREANIVLDGNIIAVETIEEYLLRVDSNSRFQGLKVALYSPAGNYNINDFVSQTEDGTISRTDYIFDKGTTDEQFIPWPDLASYVLQAEEAVEKAEEWANNPEDTEVEAGKYSALHHKEKALNAQAASEIAQGLAEDAQLAAETAKSDTEIIKNKAQEWATNDEDLEVEPGLYSSLHWAAKSEASKLESQTAQGLSETAQGLSETARDKAQEWATKEEDSEVEVGQYSSLHWATKSEASKVAAEVAQGLSEAAKDKAQEWAEKPEDSEVETGQYSALHHKEKAIDAQLAAETAQGLAEIAQGLAETAQGLSETAKGLSETARDKSQQWAENVEDVEVEAGAYSAKHHAIKASNSAAIAAGAQSTVEGLLGTPVTVEVLTPQATETLLKVNYTTGELDTEAEIIAAVNATNTKVNALITKLLALGLLAE